MKSHILPTRRATFGASPTISRRSFGAILVAALLLPLTACSALGS